MPNQGTVASDREHIRTDLSAHDSAPLAKQTALAGSKVTIEAVTKQFGDRLVLRDIDFEVSPGEFLAIVGHSGSGKSTLLRLIAGLDQPTAGRVLIDDQSLAGLNRTARMMFQEARLLPWLRVGDNVALGLDRKHLDRVPQVLSQVGLADRAADWPAILSGGQRQRVALARALACNPVLLLLDEPLGSLDALTRIEMQNLIADLWLERGSTAVLVTHNIEEAVLLADRIFVLEDGEIALTVRVDLPRPRIRTEEPFQEIVERVLSTILGPRSEAGRKSTTHSSSHGRS